MKKSITVTIAILFISFFSLKASEEINNDFYGNGYGYGKSYIFVADNVEFSVFPDGQFDFTYIGNNTNVSFSSPNVNISYNSGYNYDLFVQYDDYGAVIQVEDVPIYYDKYGRIAQAGDVEIRYSNRRIVRVGGLYVHYNYSGYYSHSTGYINPFNYYYVYQPWHTFYVRPIYASCIVYDYPYRRYYAPIRYSYYDHHNYYSNRGRNNVAYTNGRRNFHKPGSRVHNRNGRSVANRDYNPNRRNTAISQSSRRNNSTSRIATTNTSRKTSKRSEKNTIINSSNSSSRRIASNNKVNRGNTTSTSNTRKVSYKRNVSSKKNNNKYSSSSNKATSTIKRNNNSNKSNRSYSNKGNSTKRIASTSQRKSSGNSSSNSRSASSKRGRGL